MNRFILLFLLSVNCCFCKVYDCFTFFNELDLLEVRLAELYNVVDHFVIVESPISFTGKTKPLYYKENQERYSKYSDKIIYLSIDKFPDITGEAEKDHWYREAYSRDFLLNGLKHCNQDDVIFISDLDEIPKQSSVLQIQNYLNELAHNKKAENQDSDYVCGLEMRLLMYYLNCENDKKWYGGSKATYYWMVEKYKPWGIKLFHHKFQMKKFENAGWHLNTMGGKDKSLYKWIHTGPVYWNNGDSDRALLNLAAQPELLEKSFQGHIESNTRLVDMNEDYPIFILNNIDYFKSRDWFLD